MEEVGAAPVMQAEISLAEPSMSGDTRLLLRRSSPKVRRGECGGGVVLFEMRDESSASCVCVCVSESHMRESRDR